MTMTDKHLNFVRFIMWLKWRKRAFVVWLVRLRGAHFKKIGKCFTCSPRSLFKKNAITAGDYVFIGINAHIYANVQIGHFVMLASNVAIVGGDHRFDVVGVPILAHDLDFARYICGEAASFYDPWDIDSAFARIMMLRQDLTLRKALAERGKVELADRTRFSANWEEVAGDMLRELRRLAQ